MDLKIKRKGMVFFVILIGLLTFGVNIVDAAEKPYKIGLVLTLTGPYSYQGQGQKNAVELVRDNINKAGGIKGHPIELNIQDTQTDPSKAVTGVKNLLRDEEIIAIVGPGSSAESLAIIPIVEKEKIPLLSCGGSILIVQPVKKWVYQFTPTDKTAMHALLTYLKRHNLTRIAMMHATSSWGMNGADRLKELAPEYGMTVLGYESFGETDVDMIPQLTRIRDLKPQAIISWTATIAATIISKNIKQLGIKALHLHDHGFGNKKFVEVGGEAVNGDIFPITKIIVAEQIDPKDPQKKVLMEFKTEYEKRWKIPVSSVDAHVRDAMMVLKMALEAVGPDRAKVRDYIENIKNFVGCDGVFNFSPTDHNGLDVSAMVMVEVVNQDWKVIKE
jgi:branched-chain amino acid transport system substrate-binding protein